jgi:hypothetical protein
VWTADRPCRYAPVLLIWACYDDDPKHPNALGDFVCIGFTLPNKVEVQTPKPGTTIDCIHIILPHTLSTSHAHHWNPRLLLLPINRQDHYCMSLSFNKNSPFCCVVQSGGCLGGSWRFSVVAQKNGKQLEVPRSSLTVWSIIQHPNNGISCQLPQLSKTWGSPLFQPASRFDLDYVISVCYSFVSS